MSQCRGHASSLTLVFDTITSPNARIEVSQELQWSLHCNVDSGQYLAKIRTKVQKSYRPTFGCEHYRSLFCPFNCIVFSVFFRVYFLPCLWWIKMYIVLLLVLLYANIICFFSGVLILDQLITVLARTGMFVSGLTSILLDNTIPGKFWLCQITMFLFLYTWHRRMNFRNAETIAVIAESLISLGSSLSVSSVTLVYPAEAVGWTEMPFSRDTRVVPNNTVLDRSFGPSTERGDLRVKTLSSLWCWLSPNYFWQSRQTTNGWRSLRYGQNHTHWLHRDIKLDLY